MSEATLPTQAAAEPLPAAEAAPAVCANCEAALAGEFCARCGQRAWQGRFTLRAVFSQQVTEALDLNRGLLFTFVELFRRPGHMVREYVRGHTVGYANPVKYFLIMGALTTFVYVKTGLAGQMADEMAQGMTTSTNGRLSPRAGALMEMISSYFTLLLAFTLPTAAAATRWVFRRAGYNYAEHLIFNTYTGAQQCVLMIAALLLGAAAGADPQASLNWSVPVVVAYYVWAAAQFAGGPRVPALLRGILAIILSYAAFFLLVGIAGILVGVLVAVLLR
ncbi:MAG TPA: DUF3667 domain-containing protein [Longimicrobium sp.]|jgi:hypothetical protein